MLVKHLRNKRPVVTRGLPSVKALQAMIESDWGDAPPRKVARVSEEIKRARATNHTIEVEPE